MASNLKKSYYYKSPVRKQKLEKENNPLENSQVGKARKASKSPNVSIKPQSHGMPQSILSYIKLMEELKVICGTIDESTIEIEHCVELFNKREGSLKTEEAKSKAKLLRETFNIPEEL